MAESNLYMDIAKRTNGDIYIGVVGPVRTGKSTFIKKFMDTLVIPNITEGYKKERAIDELPQSAGGRTIMTTEPKFVPEEAVEVVIEDHARFKVRMIDCVGYIVPSSLGYIEGDQPRMVVTPWYDHEIPFNMAAEIGTHKVITEHSTIGLVITTDGSISDIPRDEYEEAEARVIEELKGINKPFIILLNCMYPNTNNAKQMCEELSRKYSVPVIPVNCLELTEDEIKTILAQILFEFPVKEISIDLPKWLSGLDKDHWLRMSTYSAIQQAANGIQHIRQVNQLADDMKKCEHIDAVQVKRIDLGSGGALIGAQLNQDLFYQILSENTGLEIQGEQGLMSCMTELAGIKRQYDKIRSAIDEVEATGYGIVMPSLEELSLEDPEIVRQGGRYGVRLKASAPSIHIACIKQMYKNCEKPRFCAA